MVIVQVSKWFLMTGEEYHVDGPPRTEYHVDGPSRTVSAVGSIMWTGRPGLSIMWTGAQDCPGQTGEHFHQRGERDRRGPDTYMVCAQGQHHVGRTAIPCYLKNVHKTIKSLSPIVLLFSCASSQTISTSFDRVNCCVHFTVNWIM